MCVCCEQYGNERMQVTQVIRTWQFQWNRLNWTLCHSGIVLVLPPWKLSHRQMHFFPFIHGIFDVISMDKGPIIFWISLFSNSRWNILLKVLFIKWKSSSVQNRSKTNRKTDWFMLQHSRWIRSTIIWLLCQNCYVIDICVWGIRHYI